MTTEQNTKSSGDGIKGWRIGSYTVIEEIGRGGMGVVYKAYDSSLDREVAIKVLPDNLDEDSDFAKRFVREARSAAKVDHPGIVQVYQAGRAPGGAGGNICFIAMQYVDGESLDELIKREGRLKPLKALTIAASIAEALGSAHSSGIVHRDIKSSNVLIRSDGKIKVTDFGLATLMDDSRGRITQTGAYLGTPEYSSPEQCEGGEVDGRSDIYSLGVVLYEMLSGRVPFEARTPLKLFKQIAYELPPAIEELVPSLPNEICNLLEKMLQKKREKRHQDCSGLLADIDRARESLGATKKRGRTKQRRRRGRSRGGTSKRKMLGALALVVILLSAGLGGTMAFLGGGQENPENNAKLPISWVNEGKLDIGVAIFDLDKLTGDANSDWLSHGVPRILTSKLSGCSGLSLFARSKTRDAFRDAGRSSSSAAKTLGARLAVTGSFVSEAGKLRIDLQVEDTNTGKVARAVTVSGEMTNVMSLIDQLGSELRGRFDGLLSELQGAENKFALAPTPEARACLFLAMAKERKSAKDESAKRKADRAEKGSPGSLGGAGGLRIASEKEPRKGEFDSNAADKAVFEKSEGSAPAPKHSGMLAASKKLQRGRSNRSRAQRICEALRLRFEGIEMLERAKVAEDFTGALKKLRASLKLIPGQLGMQKIIKRAQGGAGQQ
jgi:serine/threonine protein kinase